MTIAGLRHGWLTFFLSALIAALVLTPGREPRSAVLDFLIWFAACLAAEALWHPARDGSSRLSAAPTAHLAALASAPYLVALPAIVLGAGLGDLLWRRNGGRTAVATAGTALVSSLAALALVLGLDLNSFHDLALEAHSLPGIARHIAGLAGAGVLLVGVSQLLSALRASRRRGVPFGTAWSEAFGGENEFLTMFALLGVALIAHGCYEVMGFRGVLLCAMPALFVRDGSRRYVELRLAQERLLTNERLAAKGDMAAEIGHELNNYLSAILGRAQLLARSGRAERAELKPHVTGIEEISRRMADLSRGLVDFAHRGGRGSAQEINAIVERTVNFVRPQPRFRSVDFRFLPGTDLPRVDMDPGLVQQALLSILAVVVDRSRNGTPVPLAIRTFTRARPKTVGIEIHMPPAHPVPAAGAVPADAGLHDVERLLARHQGKLETLHDPGSGETYRFLLPAA